MRTFTNTDSATAWEQATAYVTEIAPSAYRLTALEVIMDADIHGVWLDETTGIVWHTWADSDVHGHLTGTWLLDFEPAAGAIEWMEEQARLALDALADPENYYGDGNRTAEEDLAVRDELYAVRMVIMSGAAEAEIARAGDSKSAAGFTVEQAVDADMRRRIDRARQEVAMLADLRAAYLSRVVGTDRGGLARAAAKVGITEGAVRKIVAAAERRREQVITEARNARTMTITTSVRNDSGAWEIINREPGGSLDGAEVFAHDIGGEPGQELLIQLLDARDNVLDSVEVTAS